MALVVLTNLCKHFGDVVAVDNFNLEIRDKDFIVLVGPSGCGKTTTLRMVAGLESITSGEIRIDGKVINDLPPKERDIAMVFQNYALYPHMTVFDNMAFSLEMRKRPKDQIKIRVRETAEILGIEHLLERKPKQLSGGQRQRVALGRAIIRKPGVFLFDEPLSNLDAKLRVQTRMELKKLHERLATTAIYVTHDQVEAMTMGDIIVVMKDGLIQQSGSPLTLYNSPANTFVAGFLGSPSMNFFEAGLEKSGGELKLRTPGFTITLPPSKTALMDEYGRNRITVGIRPEDFEPIGTHTEGLTIQALIEVVEPVGSETYVDIDTNGINLTAAVGRNTEVRAHRNITLAPRLECLHLFDIDTGQALLSPNSC